MEGTEMKLKAWKIYLNGILVEEDYFGSSMTAAEVKKALVDHDGYDPSIVVIGVRRKKGA
jgi:hypothetical protein